MNSFHELSEIWQAVYALLGEDFSSSTLDLWFGEVKLVYLSENTALMTIASDFKRNLIESKYTEILRDKFKEALGFEVDTELFADVTVETPEEAEALYERYRISKLSREEKEQSEELENAIKVISPGKKSTQ